MENNTDPKQIYVIIYKENYRKYPELNEKIESLDDKLEGFERAEKFPLKWLVFAAEEPKDKDVAEFLDELVNHPLVHDFHALEGDLEEYVSENSGRDAREISLDFGAASYKGWKENIPSLPGERGKLDFEWNHKLVRFPQAIEMTKAKRSDINLEAKLTNIKVYQLDTGYSNHKKLIDSDCYLTEKALNFIGGAEGETEDAKDNLRRYLVPPQKPGHGAATAHTVIGPPATDTDVQDPKPQEDKNIFLENLAGGLFPYVSYVPLRVGKRVVLNLNWESSSEDVLEGVKHAVKNGAHVITMSMGGDLWGKKPLIEAAKLAYKKGVIYVCAAGNSKIADRLVQVVEPAAQFPYTIAAGAIEPVKVNGQHRFYPWAKGCNGPEVDISAPAKYIYTAYIDNDFPDGVFKFGGATSQATAHVASAAAIWRHHFEIELKEDNWFAAKPSRIIDAFRWGLQRSAFIPSYWLPEFLPADADEKLRKATIESKGILNVEGLLREENGPLAYKDAMNLIV